MIDSSNLSKINNKNVKRKNMQKSSTALARDPCKDPYKYIYIYLFIYKYIFTYK